MFTYELRDVLQYSVGRCVVPCDRCSVVICVSLIIPVHVRTSRRQRGSGLALYKPLSTAARVGVTCVLPCALTAFTACCDLKHHYLRPLICMYTMRYTAYSPCTSSCRQILRSQHVMLMQRHVMEVSSNNFNIHFQ